MRRFVALVFLCGAFSASVYGKLSDIAPVPSPDGAYSASIRLLPAGQLHPKLAVAHPPDTRFAVLVLQDAHGKKTLHQITIPDADDTDHRNSIDLSWSPDGRVLVVQVQIGQLSQFTLYRVVSHRLVALDELPTPKELVIHSEHPKSRGGIFIRKWTRPDTFIAIDTVSDAQHAYRVTKQWKLQTVASKPIKP